MTGRRLAAGMGSLLTLDTLLASSGLVQEFAGPIPKRFAPQDQPLAKIVPRGRDHLYQAVGVNRDPEPFDDLFQRLQEPLPVRILPNDRLAFVAACGHVVNPRQGIPLELVVP